VVRLTTKFLLCDYFHDYKKVNWILLTQNTIQFSFMEGFEWQDNRDYIPDLRETGIFSVHKRSQLVREAKHTGLHVVLKLRMHRVLLPRFNTSLWRSDKLRNKGLHLALPAFFVHTRSVYNSARHLTMNFSYNYDLFTDYLKIIFRVTTMFVPTFPNKCRM
jgi:hypothetical protein